MNLHVLPTAYAFNLSVFLVIRSQYSSFRLIFIFSMNSASSLVIHRYFRSSRTSHTSFTSHEIFSQRMHLYYALFFSWHSNSLKFSFDHYMFFFYSIVTVSKRVFLKDRNEREKKKTRSQKICIKA